MIGKRAKEKRRASAQRLLVRCFALPFAPARLADGLELEVFYVTLTCITLRPVFRFAELWFPRVESAVRATSTSADNKFQRPNITLRKQ